GTLSHCRGSAPRRRMRREPICRNPGFSLDHTPERTHDASLLQQSGGSTMSRMIFVNLPVTDLDASMAFYKALGFENNAHFTDDTAACMVWSETINVMLLTHQKWRMFTERPIPPVSSSEVMLAISCDSREIVDDMNKVAAANGGSADINPIQDLGFMYSRALTDPDGHIWEPVWMDPTALPAQ